MAVNPFLFIIYIYRNSFYLHQAVDGVDIGQVAG